MTELKPCPFCGGSPTAIETHPGRGELYCGNCDVVLGGNNAMTPDELTEAWNTRATHGTLTAEQVHDAIFNGSSYASYDGAKYYADGIGMQAIADELNAELGNTRAEFDGIPMTEENMAEHGWVRERTCHRVRRDTWIWECSLCGSKHGYGALYNYCPNCGAKVEKERTPNG